MSPEEDRLPAAVSSATHSRDSAAVVALLDPEIDAIVGGERSRAFTGVAFDAYCRSLLASLGHTRPVRLQIEGLCGRSRRRFGDQPWTDLYDGCLLHLEGNDEAAAACYDLASRDVSVLWPSSRGCRSVTGPRQRDKFLCARQDGSVGPAGDLLALEAPAESGRHVFLAACDPGYLRRFAPLYIQSAARHGGDCNVHLHIVSPAADDLDWARRQAGEFRPRLSVSTEVYTGPDARAYYALARFVRGAQLLEFYQRPILITDIDAAFTGAVDAFLGANSGPVGLRFKRRDFHAHPWNTVQAGAVLLRPTEEGVSFARDVSTVASRLFSQRRGRDVWFIDQNVLFSVYRRYFRRAGWDFCDLNADLRNAVIFGKTL
jgi:hypothetical protein